MYLECCCLARCCWGASSYGVFSDSYYVQLLINLDMIFIYARIALVAILLIYVLAPALRTYSSRALLHASGALMIMLGVFSAVSPTLIGHNITYILLGDSLLLVEAGILSIVLGTELSANRSRVMARAYSYMQSLVFTNRPKILLRNSRPIQYSKPI